MPKTKKDSTDSDSGPEDVKPAKKSKPSSAGKSKADEEEPSWLIEKNRFLKIREFRGKVYVDIREYYESDGELKPGKKGISLSTTQWKKVMDIVDEVNETLKEKC